MVLSPLSTVRFVRRNIYLINISNPLIPQRFNRRNDGRARFNDQIRSKEVRVIGAAGENLGILPIRDALAAAKAAGLDLIEISATSVPPIAKIADYGKFLYEQKKKQKVAKAKVHNVEVKNIQVKVGTDDNDLGIKAKKASEWPAEGHRLKVDLFLPGRTKYMDKVFLESRIERLLKLLTVEYKVAETAKKSLKGLTMIVEKKS